MVISGATTDVAATTISGDVNPADPIDCADGETVEVCIVDGPSGVADGNHVHVIGNGVQSDVSRGFY